MIRFVNEFLSSGLAFQDSPPNPVAFIRNSNGHRSKDLSEIDTSNYILAAGCSHTEGYGLEIDEIYCNVLSKTLNMDCYNMGIGGSGCDVMFYNTLKWLLKYEHKPKLILLQWPFPFRYARMHDNGMEDHVQTEGSWSQEDPSKFMILGGKLKYFTLRTQLYFNIINEINVPKIHINFTDYNNTILKDYIIFNQLDKARDNQHLGPISHKKLADEILFYIKKNNLLV